MPKHLYVLLAVLLLAACSSPNPTPSSPFSSEANRDLKQWQINGKIGLRTQGKAHSAQLFWRQCDSHFDIRLTGPLGQGSARLQGTAEHARLQSTQGQDLSGPLAPLLYQHLGWAPPIDALTYWARGIPAPGDSNTLSPHSFEQQGWLLDYARWLQESNHTLPEKLSASRNSDKVTVIIRQWKLNPDCSEH